MSNAPRIVVSGLADEAGDDIETQLKAHLDLDWRSIELRRINGRMLTVDLDDSAFNHALAQIEHLGFKVEAVSSAIGNWSRRIDEDFSADIRELDLTAPRMRRLGTRFLRTMSWMRGDATDEAWRDEAVRRYRVLAKMAGDAGVILLHENCAGWGGQSGSHMVELLDRVDSPHVGLLFDIGNTISHGYQPWEFYQAVKGRIAYVHVKDCRRNPAGGRSADTRSRARVTRWCARF
jgi:sugar phosphate isomerase/epimerase